MILPSHVLIPHAEIQSPFRVSILQQPMMPLTKASKNLVFKRTRIKLQHYTLEIVL